MDTHNCQLTLIKHKFLLQKSTKTACQVQENIMIGKRTSKHNISGIVFLSDKVKEISMKTGTPLSKSKAFNAQSYGLWSS
jgi:hypothetical protein